MVIEAGERGVERGYDHRFLLDRTLARQRGTALRNVCLAEGQGSPVAMVALFVSEVSLDAFEGHRSGMWSDHEPDVARDGSSGCLTFARVVVRHSGQLGVDARGEANDSRQCDRVEQGFQNHLVEVQVWKPTTRKRVLAGDRLEEAHDVRAAGIDGCVKETFVLRE